MPALRRGLLLALLTVACGETSEDRPEPNPNVSCQGKHWTAFHPPANATTLRSQQRPVLAGNEVVFWGGLKPSDLGGLTSSPSGYRVDANTGLAQALPQEGSPQSTTSVAWLDSSLLVWGWTPNGNRGGRLTNNFKNWKMLESPMELEGRQAENSAILGKEWIIWGSGGLGGVKTDGFAYNPQTHQWSSIPDAPSPYYQSVSVRVGTHRLFVWGGDPSHQGVPDQGALYDHQKKTWTQVTTQNAPPVTPEPLMHYVTASNEVIVWLALKETGARFSLDSMSWTPMSVEGAPEGAGGMASTLLDGPSPKLLVFGGTMAVDFELTKQNTVYVYDVVSDRWSTMPEDKCSPPPISDGSFTALSDNNSALYWGGLEETEPFGPERGWRFVLEP